MTVQCDKEVCTKHCPAAGGRGMLCEVGWLQEGQPRGTNRKMQSGPSRGRPELWARALLCRRSWRPSCLCNFTLAGPAGRAARAATTCASGPRLPAFLAQESPKKKKKAKQSKRKFQGAATIVLFLVTFVSVMCVNLCHLCCT